MKTVDKFSQILRREDSLRLVAIILPLLFLLISRPGAIVVCLYVLSIVAFWQLVFFYVSRRKNNKTVFGLDLVYTALLFMILLPEGLPWWQTGLSVSFGVVLGEQVFGGRGYSFVSPVIAGLAFQFYSFPGEFIIPIDTVSPFILVVPFCMLLWLGQIVWQALLGVVLAGTLCLLILSTGSPDIATTTAVGACILFAACDPAISPVTLAGKLAYGLLTGVLLLLFDPGLALLDQAVFACMLGSIAAPLIDWIAQQCGAVADGQHRHAAN